jgi:uncharacterized membrane protein
MGEVLVVNKGKGGRGMKSLKLVASLLVFLWMATWTVSMVGCGGGAANVRQDSYATTLGQELEDLDQAYKKGIITEKEYERAKERLIKQRTRK